MANVDGKLKVTAPSITTSPASVTDRLQSDDSDTRNAALAEIFGEAVAVLTVTSGNRTHLTYTAPKTSAGLSQLFTVLLWATVQFAKSMGLDLNWVPSQPDPDEIVIAKGDVGA